jgi:hypothetical protein
MLASLEAIRSVELLLTISVQLFWLTENNERQMATYIRPRGQY